MRPITNARPYAQYKNRQRLVSTEVARLSSRGAGAASTNGAAFLGGRAADAIPICGYSAGYEWGQLKGKTVHIRPTWNHHASCAEAHFGTKWSVPDLRRNTIGAVIQRPKLLYMFTDCRTGGQVIGGCELLE